jgi:hypothetical protein
MHTCTNTPEIVEFLWAKNLPWSQLLFFEIFPKVCEKHKGDQGDNFEFFSKITLVSLMFIHVDRRENFFEKHFFKLKMLFVKKLDNFCGCPQAAGKMSLAHNNLRVKLILSCGLKATPPPRNSGERVCTRVF